MTAVDEAVARWIDTWTRGWRDHDAELIAALYADDALFVSGPFREPARPGDYVRWAFADEDEVELWFGEPLVGADGAAVQYWAVIRSGGHEETLAGVSLVRFGATGVVVEQRDYWSTQPGAKPPPPGWGPVVTHAVRR